MTDSPAPPPEEGAAPPPPPPPPPAPAPPPPMTGVPGAPTSDDRTWAMLAHLSILVLSIIGPIIVMVTKGKESAYVRQNAVEALNFQITWAIAFVVSLILIIALIGLLLFPVVWIGGIVLGIIAGVKANQGESYRYPINIRMVK